MTRIADCDNCGQHAPVACRYERLSPNTQTFVTYQFCCGACSNEWLRIRNRMPNPGIVFGNGLEAA
jgi:hypothetical protein